VSREPVARLSLVVLAESKSSAPEATKELGRRLAPALRPGDILLIEGDLGAGKTTFVQGLAAGLGITDPVSSPTFTLMRVLEVDPTEAAAGGVKKLLHADLYRLDDLRDVSDLGLLELVEDEEAVAAVEWGHAGAAALGDDVLEIHITQPGDDGRVVTLLGAGPWADRREALAAAWPEPDRPD
jgi:tRNA threonylcarbamoyladenosine biosynthesis protein TsaE